MSETRKAAIAVVGIDIGKNSFHVVGLDQRGAIVLRQRWSRGQVEVRFANMPPCLIGMEACVGAHHLSRRLQALGHEARLMPAKYVRPYSKGQKNDFRDAEAIAEAVQRPTMKFVATKSVDQLDLQALHRVRERLVRQRTGVVNQIRAFLLERGVAVRQGPRALRAALPRILAVPADVLSPRMVRLIEELADDWRALDGRIERLSAEIEATRAPGCRLRAADERAGDRADRLQRDGGGDRRRRDLRQRPRLRRLARARAQANLDRRPHDPGQDLEARQSLFARLVCPGGVGRPHPAQELGALWAAVLARGGETAATPQRAGHRARQQAGPDRLERPGAGRELRSTPAR